MSGNGGGGSSSSSPTKRTHPQRLPPIKTTPSPSQQAGLAPPKPQPSSHTPPLLLTVRFSTSIPDLLLDIPHPNRTTVAALKHLIRSRLEQPNSQRRLRFIHGGKILADTIFLGAVLKPIPPPPSPSAPDLKGKGKAGEPSPQRVYVNCSIGDLLTDAELAEERRRAEEPVPEQQQLYTSSSTATTHGPGTPLPAADGSSSTSRGPRGFDRLLASGFSPAEVNQLRLQFRSIQEARHTADTLPSPDSMRSMEDAWLDSDNNAGLAGPAAMAGGPSLDGEEVVVGLGGGEEFGMAGVLDLLLRGMFIGFVWPLGAIGWLVRGDEEKIPKRMRVFVYFGFVLSFLIGTIRVVG